MNILFLTLSQVDLVNGHGIYSDLIRELDNQNANVFVVSPYEKRQNKKTELLKYNKINVLKVSVGNITKTKSQIEKGISTLTLEYHYLSAIKEYFKNIGFDMILYSTPPITFTKILNYFKSKQNTITYLMLKDIFPQNAVDLNLIKKNGFIFKYFERKERNLYINSDIIGCMSPRNIEYLLENNAFINKNNVELFPNSIKISPPILKKIENKLLDRYDIPLDKTLFVYGGNLGKPQGIDYLLNVIDEFYQVKDSHLIIVGNGTEYNKIFEFIDENSPKNVSLIPHLPKDEYDSLLLEADVGLIFLDNRFTIPNFPSRLTAYLEHSLPIIAATDTSTDIGKIAQENQFGFWIESKKVDNFIKLANKLAHDINLREKLGKNGRRYLEDNYNVEIYAQKLIKHIENKRG